MEIFALIAMALLGWALFRAVMMRLPNQPSKRNGDHPGVGADGAYFGTAGCDGGCG